MSITPENDHSAASNRLSQLLRTQPNGIAEASVDPAVMIRVVILGGLFAWLHWRVLYWMGCVWMNNPNWSHGFLIPLFSLYLVYSRWDDIRRVKSRPFLGGLVLMVLCLLAEVSIMSLKAIRNYWLLGMTMVTMLLAMVLYLGGRRLIRVVWLPIVFLVLSVPLSESIYNRVAYPLQEAAAQGAVIILNVAGVDITRQASSLSLLSRTMQTRDLTVAEACSGMRLLMAFFALGVATAYLESRPIWQRVVLVGMALPIAVFCNVLRVAITCTMYYIDRPELGKGVLHNFTGMLMLIPAFGMLYGLGWILNRLFVEVDEDEDQLPAESAPPGAVGGQDQ
ncbi:MAG: exosortase/archaeosortase family protein [Planctomycetes bacterium]|nr:exosortase/archaeosortase family protein [Planctomycetota bacterium]